MYTLTEKPVRVNGFVKYNKTIPTSLAIHVDAHRVDRGGVA